MDKRFLRPGRFEYWRPDGVMFYGDVTSPNGTLLGPDNGPGWHLTAGDAYWASVPVGRFASLVEVAAACETFAMPLPEDRKSSVLGTDGVERDLSEVLASVRSKMVVSFEEWRNAITPEE